MKSVTTPNILLKSFRHKRRKLIHVLEFSKSRMVSKIRRLEKEADDPYFKAVGELFHKPTDPINLIKLKELYETLEIATDRCERVGNMIESVILKHN